MSQSRRASQTSSSFSLAYRARPSVCSNNGLINDVQVTLPAEQRLPSLSASSDGLFSYEQSFPFRTSNAHLFALRQPSFSNDSHHGTIPFTDLPTQYNRSSIQMQMAPIIPCFNPHTIQPQAMFQADQFPHPYQVMHDIHRPYNTCSPSSLMAASPASRCIPVEDMYPEPVWPYHPNATHYPHNHGPSSISDVSEDDTIYDKPYAQLIYEALLKAPGHRMLLRDIYEWFIQNTNKPRESGTNGWQNSIRHNLSMNKAFENDKSDPASARGARKANSVWILTEAALKHGVQSTTRYRKSGPTKKSCNKRPAIQRQRSGAKGGRAAKRAAHLRRHMETPPRTIQHVADYSPTISSPQDGWSNTSASPATPTDNFLCYGLPDRLGYGYEDAGAKYELDMEDDYQLHHVLSQAMPKYADMSHLRKESE